MIYINAKNKQSKYIQIYQQVREEILSGTLRENQTLIGSRTLATTLQVSRNTVDNAYAQLCAEGYVAYKRGVGFVILPLPTNLQASQTSAVRSASFPTDNQAHTDSTVSPPIAVDNVVSPALPVKFDLTNSSFTSDLFPKALWKKYTPICLDLLDHEAEQSPYQNKDGSPYLRRHLLSYLQKIRGVTCTEDQIIITCGFQSALATVCDLILAEHAQILIEEPGFDKATSVFQNKGCTIQGIPVDEHGLITSQLNQYHHVKAIYTTPSHQFPTGVTMPIGRRYELLQFATDHGAYIIEDDFDSELRYYARPIPSLQSIDSHNVVIYLGTFSKAISPSIRMGYLILPPHLKRKYDQKYSNYTSTVPLLNQLMIGKLLETEQYDKHIRKLNQIFRKRLELFLKEFSGLEDKIQIQSNGSGQYFLLRFTQQVDQQALIKQALDHGVRVYSTMNFWQDHADCPPNTLFLGFSKISLGEIPDCVACLKAAWHKWLY